MKSAFKSFCAMSAPLWGTEENMLLNMREEAVGVIFAGQEVIRWEQGP
jgi:hypothetical protein